MTIRPTGTYARVDGHERPLVGRLDLATVTYLEKPRGPFQQRNLKIAAEAVEDILKVRTTAQWRGGTILVSSLGHDDVGFITEDRSLAVREGLSGDQYSGWAGVARLDDLSQVEEQVTVLHEGPLIR